MEHRAVLNELIDCGSFFFPRQTSIGLKDGKHSSSSKRDNQVDMNQNKETNIYISHTIPVW